MERMLSSRGMHSEVRGIDVREILEKILVLSLYKIIPLLKRSSLFAHLELKVMMENKSM